MASDRKTPGPVEQSIARLRELRYMTRGPGAARSRKTPPAPTINQLRDKVAKVAATPKKSKKRKARRR